MPENSELLCNRLQQLLPQKRSNAFYAQKLGVPLETIYNLRKKLNGKDSEESTSDIEKEVNVDKGTIKSTVELTFDAQDIDQLYELHKVDKSLYKITNYWSKLKSTGKFTSSVLASQRKADNYSVEDFVAFLKDYNPKPIKVTKVKDQLGNTRPIVDVEISIADFHLDRKVIAGDTIEERKEEYRKVVNGLMQKVQGSFRVRKLVFVIGNDYFNTDNYHNQTTNLTPQEITVPWHKAYEEGFDLLVETISKLSHEADELEVVLIQGNHDRTKSFYLAHALEVFFKSYKNIKFQRHNSNTKFVVLGNTFIGYHHGNHIKIDGLPLYFAMEEESRAYFGLSQYHEVHTGDKHHYMAKDIQKVRIQQIPSMVKPDNFTNDGLYLHIKAGIAFCYDPVKGRIAEFEHRI
jgi:hypothetical protein